MRPVKAALTALRITRRGMMTGAAAAGVAGTGVAAAPAPAAADPVLRDAALRGLALTERRGDGVAAETARAAMSRLAETDPEGALLVRLYRKLDVLPAQSWHRRSAVPAHDATLALLHEAMARCVPVGFAYTDLEGDISERTVLPLALVHPPQGVKLLAWCNLRAGYRQFFVREITALTELPGDFTGQRMALLQGLAEKEGV